MLYPGFTALDVLGPHEVLKYLPEVEIRFVAQKPGPISTDRSTLIVGATHSFDETPAPFLVLVPGSEAKTTTAMADGRLVAWLKQAHETSTWTASVCSGALITEPSLQRFGTMAMPNSRMVRSGKIWTAAGGSAGLDMALALLGEIAGQEAAEVAQLMIE